MFITNKSSNNAKKWFSWYVGNVPSFHSGRFVEHNGEHIPADAQTLKMAKQVVEDWVFLITNEMEYNDDAKQVEEFFNDSDNDMSLFLAGVLTTGQGLAICLKPDENQPAELVLFDKRYYETVREEYEGKMERGYRVSLGDNKVLVVLNDINILIKRDLLTGTDKIVESPFKPAKELTFIKDLEYPEGKSIYADAIDVLQEIDLTYTDLNTDRDFSKPMILVGDQGYMSKITPPTFEELQADENAQPKVTQWLHKGKRMFKALATPNQSKEMPIEKVNFDMKIESYVKALNTHLSLFSKKCRLGDEYYSFDKATNSIKTATEIIDKNSDIARNLKKLRDIYKTFLWELYEQVEGTLLQDTFIKFGDGIMTDDRYERDMALKEYDTFAAVDLAINYLVEYKGYTEEEAKRIMLNEYISDENSILDVTKEGDVAVATDEGIDG